MAIEALPACRRAQWLAVLFGPAGCTARWLLSQANYTLPGRWKWLPAGTLAANMIACLVDYVVGVCAAAPWECQHAQMPVAAVAMHRGCTQDAVDFK